MAHFRKRLTYFIILCISIPYIGSTKIELNGTFLRCEHIHSAAMELEHVDEIRHTVDNCNRKIRLTLRVYNSDKTPEEEDFFMIDHIHDHELKTNVRLLNPIAVKLRQEQVLLAYPFHYLTSVNGKAKEIIVNYETVKNFTGCDDTSPVQPTCGLKHERGKVVPYSEGFCCPCPEGKSAGKHMRGGQDCSVKSTPSEKIGLEKYKASAHCLHFSEIWYIVNALNHPVIEHTVYLQAYNRQESANGSAVWVDVTHNVEFTIGTQNPFQFDENKTIVATYATEKPSEDSITIPYKVKRLLVPQPMPHATSENIPIEMKNGATDYILLSKDLINPEGNECDKAGVSYEAFAKQDDRCETTKDSCLKNQPLDFWTTDDEKRKAGEKGKNILEFFGIPYKDPILMNETTGEHWLALEYYTTHLSMIYIEMDAGSIIALRVGKHAQITSVITASTESGIDFYVHITNAGLVASEYVVKAVRCITVPDSTSQSAVIAPQEKHEYNISTKYGMMELTEEITCVVEVSSSQHGVVALRKVTIKPMKRCICILHCLCACLGGSLKCEPMEEELFHLAGFRGSLPVLSAKPPYKPWIAKHPGAAFLAFILILLLLGTIKAGSGFLGYSRIGDIGLNTCLHGPKQLPEYLEPELKDVGVIYDDKGYPIHPDTREYARIIGPKLQLLINTFYFFIWPCILIQDKMIEKKNYVPVSQNEDIELTKDQLAAARTEEESEQVQSMFEDSYGSNEMSTSPSANETLDATAKWQGAMGKIVT